MNRADEVRQAVSEQYARAVVRAGGCCQSDGPSGGCCQAAPGMKEGVGYQLEELEGLPEVVSFGCGNPLAFSEVEPGQTVVDLGSGAGLDLLLAARKVGPEGRVIGVDMTDEMIERARANARMAGFDQVEVRKGLIERLPVESGTVDWVISNCVINLSPEKDRVFAEIARVLKPGGRMLVSDIVVENMPWVVRALPPATLACVKGAISEAEYIRGLQRAGLTDVQVRGRTWFDGPTIRGFLEDYSPLARLIPRQADPVIERFARRLWSAKFEARKA